MAAAADQLVTDILQSSSADGTDRHCRTLLNDRSRLCSRGDGMLRWIGLVTHRHFVSGLLHFTCPLDTIPAHVPYTVDFMFLHAIQFRPSTILGDDWKVVLHTDKVAVESFVPVRRENQSGSTARRSTDHWSGLQSDDSLSRVFKWFGSLPANRIYRLYV